MLMVYKGRVDRHFFYYDYNVYDVCLSNTFGDTESDVKYILKSFCKMDEDKIILLFYTNHAFCI